MSITEEQIIAFAKFGFENKQSNGFPEDMTADILEEKGFLPKELRPRYYYWFNKFMEKHREVSRRSAEKKFGKKHAHKPQVEKQS